jgi:hypothetical protein
MRPHHLVAILLLISPALDAAPASVQDRTIAWVGDSRMLPGFPKENPAAFLADYKILGPNGSPVRVPQEDWEGARRRVAEDPRWRDWLQRRRAEVDAWMRRHHDRVEWQAGWAHDFVSPKDGSFLVWTDEIPGEETRVLRSLSGHQVELTPGIFPKIFGGWVMTFRGQNLYQITEAARLYRFTGDKRYLDWAAGQLDFYAENLEGWPVSDSKGNHARLGCQSLEDAIWLARFVDAVRLLRDDVAAERRQAWFDKLLKPQAELLGRSFQIIHNIAVWHRSSQAQVALVTGDRDLWTRVMDGEYGLRAQLRRGVTSDYLWYEQSMGYNEYIVNATYPLFLTAGLLGESERLHEEAAIVQNLLLSPLLLRFADGSLPNPADINKTITVPSPWLRNIHRVLPTPLGIAATNGRRDWDALVDPPPAWSGPATLPEIASRHFASSRFALLRQGPWQVFFHYGQINRSHSQDEALNWSASFDGVDVSHDPGTVGYGSPLTKGYYRRGLCHNVPLIDGEGQMPWKPGTLTTFDAAGAIMTGEQPEYRPGVSARRTLRIVGDHLIDEATITCTRTENAHPRLGLALHLQGKAMLPEIFTPASDFAQGRPEPFRQWTQVRSATFTHEARVEIQLGEGTRLSVRFAAPGRFVLYQGSSPDLPPRRRVSFYLESLEPKREITFVTDLSVAPSSDSR